MIKKAISEPSMARSFHHLSDALEMYPVVCIFIFVLYNLNLYLFHKKIHLLFYLFCFILFYFILFYFILFYFILFYFILFYFILFYFILFYFHSLIPIL